MKLSVIIPTLNEERSLGRTLNALAHVPAEIIVSDGGSQDGTIPLAQRYTPHVIQSPPGRGVQLDTGARRATGDVFLFLHADTRIPKNTDLLIHDAFQDPGVVFGAFCLAIDAPGFILKAIASGANLRSKLFKLPYGDQAIFVRAPVYFHAGGFPHWPLMEDVAFVRRLNHAGRFVLVPTPVHSSSRRWDQEGPVFTTVRNLWLLFRFFANTPPHLLAKHYGQRR